MLASIWQNIEAQHHYKQLTTSNGLPSNTVYSVTADHKGYLWFGTSKGATQFDGVNLKNFTVGDGLNDNNVFEIVEDDSLSIWFRTFLPGLSKFEGNTPKMLPTSPKVYKEHLGNSFATGIQANGNNIEVFGNSKILHINKQTGTVEKVITLGKDLGKELLHSFDFHTNQQLNRINIYPTEIHHLYPDETGEPFASKTWVLIKSKFSDRTDTRGNALRASNGDIFFFIRSSVLVIRDDQIIQTLNTGSDLISMAENPSGGIHFNYFGKGSIEYHDVNGTYQPVREYLKGKSVTAFCSDHEGGYWFSTYSSGVFYLSNPEIIQFSTKDGLSSNSITNILYDTRSDSSSSKLWIGYGFGKVQGVDFSEGKIKVTTQLDYYKPIRETDLSEKGSEPYFTSDIIQTQNGDIYYSTTQNRLNKVVGNDVESIHYGSGKTLTGFRCITSMNDSELWVGTRTGIARISNEHEIDTSIFLNVRTNAIKADSYIVWIGTYRGLMRFDTALHSIPILETDLHIRITDIKIWKRKVWLATHGFGVFGLDKNAPEKIIRINKNQGLASDICQALTFDSLGNLWVGTNMGLNKVVFSNDTSMEVTLYAESNGLSSNEIQSLACVNDLLAIGTNQGLSLLPLSDTSYVKAKPKLNLASVTDENFNFYPTDSLVLPHTTKTIVFEVNKISYQHPEDRVFYYRISGTDDDWIKSSSSTIRYNNLSSGEYILEIKAPKYNQEYTAIQSIPFSIQTPWWKTTWFKLLVSVWLIGLILCIHYIRLRLIKKRYAQQNQLLLFQLHSLNAQINPHFLYNSLNAINGYILTNDAFNASKYLSKFANLMRSTLDLCDKDFISLDVELVHLEKYLYLEQLRFGEKFEYKLSVAPEVPLGSLFIPPLILQPFAENAILHGFKDQDKKGLLTIEVVEEDNKYCVVITDNGKGINQAKANDSSHKSKGITLIKDRIALHNDHQPHKLSLSTEDLSETHSWKTGTRISLCIAKNLNI